MGKSPSYARPAPRRPLSAGPGFALRAPFAPAGDQPAAIAALTEGAKPGSQQTLLGVTGSGKTFTVASVINNLQLPTLVLSHNKTLAAQLYQELQDFFPDNRVCYFVSYYDYYQPESYLPASDTYIEKDVLINEKIEQLRLEAATSLLTRRDVIVVSSVSCIYGFGRPEDYAAGSLTVTVGQELDRDALLRRLVGMLYERNDVDLRPGRFRARGGTVDVLPGSAFAHLVRLTFEGDRIASITEHHRLTGRLVTALAEVTVFPAKSFVVPDERRGSAISAIRAELEERVPQLGPLEAYRLRQRTEYDLEMIEQLGYCKGIENYSRHFDHRTPGSHPYTLLDFFEYAARDWLMVMDESHATLPQVGGMYHGDRARKKNLVDYGFRLPSAYDNRPLTAAEFDGYLRRVIYTSATPAAEEISRSSRVVEQIIRPTGLVDPPVEVRPVATQVPDLISELKSTVAKNHRALVTTLTKKLAEDLSQYLVGAGLKCEYLHAEIETLERTELLRRLRSGVIDVVVGINLLREGLDLPEVALVAILDADREGFLRNATSLIQTIGRAARNIDAKVIMYADRVTGAMREAIHETERRRERQLNYNRAHHITPQGIHKAIRDMAPTVPVGAPERSEHRAALVEDLDTQMREAAEALDFERAIELRERIRTLQAGVAETRPRSRRRTTA
ncbi:MAG: UvrABC system protein B [Parcubacteria group bacterium Gr01-1014_31]|nr:MAG: UvrABC system protein B [Parcubacteria group bacterium Gr01-1014_31]